MKKLLVILMVLAVVAPVMAMADDTLDVSGQYRVEYYNISNNGFSDADTADLDYWDGRFRLQMNIKPADGVMAVLRADLTEGEWGLAGMPNASHDTRPSPGDQVMMVDRAYADIHKGMVQVIAGLYAFNLGDMLGYNNQGTGIEIAVTPGPMKIRLAGVKEDEGGALDDDSDTGSGDTNSYLLDIGFKNDMLAANVYYAMDTNDVSANENEPTLLGAMVVTKIAMIDLKAFIEIWGGQQSDTVDYTGINFYADGAAKLTDAFKVGAEIVYADGNDDTDKTKLVRHPRAATGDRQYLERGPLMGTATRLRALGANDLFDIDPGAGQAGSLGLRPYVEFKALPELTLYANIGYFVAGKDVDTVESALTYGAGVKWDMAPKTALSLQYLAVDLSEDGDYTGTDYETFSAVGAMMTVAF